MFVNQLIITKLLIVYVKALKLIILLPINVKYAPQVVVLVSKDLIKHSLKLLARHANLYIHGILIGFAISNVLQGKLFISIICYRLVKIVN